MHVLLIGMGGVNAAFKNWTEPSLARALVGRGHQVSSYSYLDPKAPAQRLRAENVDGVRVQRVALGPIGYAGDLWRAMRRDRLPDVVHVHHLRNQLLWQVTLFYQRRGVPVVLSPIGLLHDRFITDDRDDPYEHPIKYDNLIFDAGSYIKQLAREFAPRKHLRNWLTHFPMRRADHLIALSQYEKGLFVKLGIPAHKITVIPFAVDLKLIDAALAAPPLADYTAARPRIVFVGQLKYRKGFDLLIRAAPQVRAAFPTATFIFLTHNLSQRDAFMQIVNQVGAAEYIQLLKQRGGAETETEKMQQLAASDVFVFPTRYEGFGIPLLEAMAARVPIVTTDIPVVDEIIQDGENGVLARLNDPASLAAALIRVLRQPSLRARIVAQGRARVEATYTDAQLGERTEKVYHQVIPRK